jgi:hypothetical protein
MSQKQHIKLIPYDPKSDIEDEANKFISYPGRRALSVSLSTNGIAILYEESG